ncbi:MAG: hypothetical protein OES57_06505, partial [Acidimicrobiia bacterium]|nr:hypothetical protein [Acidimicrobiia bacterium]
DVTAISKAVGQRTHWIRFMYDREMELSAEIERLRGELSSRPAVLPGASTLRRWFRRSPRLQALAPKGSRRRRTLRRAAGHH